MVTMNTRAATILREGGVFVPAPMALDEHRRMVEERQRLLTLYYIRSGARAVIPGTHTGEFAGGDLALYDRWLGLTKDMTLRYGKENKILMAAVGGPQARKMAELAAKHGYDIAMVAPTAFTKQPEDRVVECFRDIASIIPTFGFELQRLIPGSHSFSHRLWLRLFEITYGAKGASFDTYRSLVMLEAAAASDRRESLTLLTGNDDRIVADLSGTYRFGDAVVRYAGGLLGHMATDTRAAARWMDQTLRCRDGEVWQLPLSPLELAHAVNRCNMALFDALHDFANSVWGVKQRLTQLGLLQAPWCLHESGDPAIGGEIARIYGAYPDITDNAFVAEHLDAWKAETGVRA